MSPSTYYRARKPKTSKLKMERQTHPRALTVSERAHILEVLHEERFVDKAPAAIYATLLDEKRYLCSISSMYRILRAHKEVRARRNQLRHPNYKKPELLAVAPNQVWSWDITKLLGPAKWTYYYFYVIIDIYSRYVVGWRVATGETGKLARELIETSCMRQGIIDTNQLTIHSDRGSAMTSKTVALLMSELGVTKSLNRPHVSNDNPYSESHFKTLKYGPNFPDKFGSIEDAKAFCKSFVTWYNYEHYHSGIGLMTPYMVHSGKALECNTRRQAVLASAYELHPERFVGGQPKTIALPEAAWINPPPKQIIHTSII